MGLEADEVKYRWPDGTGMIYFGMSPWVGMWKSRHQLMSRFARGMPVLYVQPSVGLRSLRSKMSGVSRIFTDLRRPLKVSENSEIGRAHV